MPDNNTPTDYVARFYLEPAAAYVRHALAADLGSGSTLTAAELVHAGLRAGLRLHRFTRTADLPRVRRILRILHALALANVHDVGSGRGVLLCPLLDTFPELRAVASSGLTRLHSGHRLLDERAARGRHPAWY